ncbi:hypothetical protein ASG52_10120 [Methylobacterium sp. Leaf456]|nr:hypothetical protein ASG52_10120 [Methylobacterium sp. Leaf456]
MSFPFYAPLSGAVTQDFSNSLYQGVPEIELAVITEAGSFGSQLGALTKVVLELARQIVPDCEKIEARTREELEKNAEVIKEKKTHLEQLIILDKLVDDIKERHRRAAERDARRALEQLKKFDEDRYASFVRSLNR